MSSSQETCIGSRLNQKMRNTERLSPPRNEKVVDGLMIVQSSINYCGRRHNLAGPRIRNTNIISLIFLFVLRARSRLYRRRSLKVKTHFSAFLEIYKICIPSHRSKFRSLRKIRQHFAEILPNFNQNHRFSFRFS